MRLIRSLLFALFFYVGSALIVLTAIGTIPFGRNAVRESARIWARWHRWCCRHIAGVTTRIEGTLPAGPVLIAAKHQAMYETIDLVIVLDTPSLVMKRELSKIPLWGILAQRYGMIVVDRDGGAAALRRLMREAGEVTGEGRPIVIFPEGTRVLPGQQPELQPGFAGLYRTLRLPVVPLALDSGLCMPRRGFLKHPGHVTYRFGEAIPAGLPREQIETRVHAAINALES
jgi:1-acyl-sn-glycerol-3-phosphate acyltransferase